jgi:DNA modification methylase
MTVELYTGDCRALMSMMLDDESVQCCVTSPPYFGLRDYGHAGQLGMEPTPAEYVDALVSVFREVRRALRDDGTLWLNLGDSYANDGKWGGRSGGLHDYGGGCLVHQPIGRNKRYTGLKPKDLIGIPWRVAFALQADGWYLRQDIIWHKPNPMPESVRDRCTKAHEYIFLLSKSERYYFDSEAIAEALAPASIARLSQPTLAEQAGSNRVPGKTNGAMKAVARAKDSAEAGARNPNSRPHSLSEFEASNGRVYEKRNKRSVWTVTTKPFKGAHFATFPPDLIEPCILAGSRAGDLVLDPFGGGRHHRARRQAARPSCVSLRAKPRLRRAGAATH